MATNFPTSLDTLTNPSATDTLDSPHMTSNMLTLTMRLKRYKRRLVLIRLR